MLTKPAPASVEAGWLLNTPTTVHRCTTQTATAFLCPLVLLALGVYVLPQRRRLSFVAQRRLSSIMNSKTTLLSAVHSVITDAAHMVMITTTMGIRAIAGMSAHIALAVIEGEATTEDLRVGALVHTNIMTLKRRR